MNSPYRESPPSLERLPLDDAARAHLRQAIRSAVRRVMICLVVILAWLTGLVFSYGLLLLLFPLDFLIIGLSIELWVELRHAARAFSDRAGGLLRGEGELRWHGVAYQVALDDGRFVWLNEPAPVLGRWRVTVLPHLHEVLDERLVAEAAVSEARATQDDAMDTLLRVTPETLARNLAGRLTTAQRLRLLRRSLWSVALLAGYVGWFALTGLHWGSVLLGLPALGFGWLAWQRIAAAASGRARVLEGVVTARQRGGKYPRYYLVVDGESIEADLLVWRAFRLSGARHRLIACTVDPRAMGLRALA